MIWPAITPRRRARELTRSHSPDSTSRAVPALDSTNVRSLEIVPATVPCGSCSRNAGRSRPRSSPPAPRAVLSELSERVGWRARQRGVVAGHVTLKLRYTDFHTISRGRTVEPTSVDVELHRVASELYREARIRDLPIRLLGVALAKLQLDAVQLPLFDAGERRCLAVDRVRDRFGYHAVHLATTLGRGARRGIRD